MYSYIYNDDDDDISFICIKIGSYRPLRSCEYICCYCYCYCYFYLVESFHPIQELR